MTEPIKKEINNLQKTVKEYMMALSQLGCDPTWQSFSNTFQWFKIKQKLNPVQQDRFHEIWLHCYRKKTPRGKLAGNPRGAYFADQRGSSYLQ